MVTRDLKAQRILHDKKFLVGVIDDCDESDRAVLELMGVVARPRDVRMFHGHHALEHVESTGAGLGQLEHTLAYLQALLMVEGSMLSEYGQHGGAGRHFLLIDGFRDYQIHEIVLTLANRQAYNIRLLGSSHVADLIPSR